MKKKLRIKHINRRKKLKKSYTTLFKKLNNTQHSLAHSIAMIILRILDITRRIRLYLLDEAFLAKQSLSERKKRIKNYTREVWSGQKYQKITKALFIFAAIELLILAILNTTAGFMNSKIN